MTDRTRIRIAAAVTALFLAGVSAAGLAARDDGPRAAAPAAQTPAATAAPVATPDQRAFGDDEGYEEREDDE